MTNQPLPPSLTDLDAALAELLRPLTVVPSRMVPLAKSRGLIAAASPPPDQPFPPCMIASIDGWACNALDLIGASPMSPVPLTAPPSWVEVGQALPDGCDAVLQGKLVQKNGPFWIAIGEAMPGEGVIRRGEHLAAGSAILRAGHCIGAADILLAEILGASTLSCHIPKVRVIDVSDSREPGPSCRFVRSWLGQIGAEVEASSSLGRNAAHLATMIDETKADLTVTIGGTGQGRRDETAAAIAQAGRLAAHGIAFSSCLTAGFGWRDDHPIIALPAAPEAAMIGCLGLLTPVIDRLSGRQAVQPLCLPLTRKITSPVGLAELALFRRQGDGWMPIAVGRLSLDQLRRADGWVIVPSGDEGYPAGEIIGARPVGNLG